MDWDIIEQNLLSPQDIDRQGIKMLIGNGYIGYRGTLEEFNKDMRTATIVSGLYDQVGDQWREPVNLPNGCFVQVTCAGERLNAVKTKANSHKLTLNMKSALHTRQTEFALSNGTKVTIRSKRFASLERLNLICMEYSICSDHECEVEIMTGIDGDVWDINGPHLCGLKTESTGGVISVHAVTNEKSIPICVSEAISFSPENDSFCMDEDQSSEEEMNSIYRKIIIHKLQKPFVFYKFISHFTGLDIQTPQKEGIALCLLASQLGFEKLFNEHVEKWRSRWTSCDIQIEGDAEAQLALRFSQYHLLSIVPAHSEYASIPARGISGQMYKGAIFWDTEIFMLPFFTHTFPEMARSLLLYRYHTLDGARRKAREYGFRGAFYAWESQDNGDDACTLFNVTDVFTNRPMRTYFRDKQVHISADIVYALWQYYQSTADASILQDGGAEIIFECARFFLSYIYFNPDKDRYEILDVTGPDEYHERVHNNAFTNRLVENTFNICVEVAELLNLESKDFFSSLIEKLDYSSDLESIKNIFTKIYLPDVNFSDQVIPQFDGYLDLENVSIHDLHARKLNPNEYLGGGNGLATTTQIIKQADVMLMLYLFNDYYSPKTKSLNWDFYEPRTEHGSSLSLCSYSLIASQINRIDWAYSSFMKTASMDMKGEGKQFVGTLYIGGTHTASDGGAWMALVFGLCGIHPSKDFLEITPHLPSHWKNVTIPFVFQGQTLRITLSNDHMALMPTTTLSTSISIKVENKIYQLNNEELIISFSMQYQ